ncbi:MAG: hypothetical protein ACR2OI_02305 [Acidimicrobiia bacterium]
MRQIRPRTRPTSVPPQSISEVVSVDLRQDHAHPASPDTGDLWSELARTRSAVADLMGDLAALVNEREKLKARLAGSEDTGDVVFDPDDQSVVPWGFYEDDDF